MNKFGQASLRELSTADARFQRLSRKVLAIKDHSIIKGHRGKEEQNAAFNATPQRSKLPWPKGNHNDIPSKALDVRTYPSPDDEQALREDQLYLLGLYKGVASEMGIPLRTGADWDRDGEIADNGFDDFFHVEIT